MILKGYRTYIVNGVVALGAIAYAIWPEAEVPTGEQAGAFVDQAEALIVAGLAIVNGFLRSITTTPPGKPK
ncbi:MAG: hypothetical protein ACR2PW_04565 [Gammaproteobacteria bacterium]